MLTFLILGILLVMAIVIGVIAFVVSGRRRAGQPSPGSRVNEPAQTRAIGPADN